eukprot:SAG31_NODE_9103_length_1334_cov_0.944939_1_plen_139_part_00
MARATVECREYAPLFLVPDPVAAAAAEEEQTAGEAESVSSGLQETSEATDGTVGQDRFLRFLNPKSLTIHRDCAPEPSLLQKRCNWFQFEREGYYYAETGRSGSSCTGPGAIFHCVVPLRDSRPDSARHFHAGGRRDA